MKTTINFFFILLLFSRLQAQTTSYLQWQKTFGGTAYDTTNSIQQTSDGGYIVGGYTNSNDRDISGNHGGADVWLMKLSSSGTLLWQQVLGGSHTDHLTSVQQISDGGYILAGTSASTDGDFVVNKGSHDVWVIRLKSNGNLRWKKNLGGSNWDRVHQIRQTTDGGFILAGGTNSNDGDISLNRGDSDAWVVKLNSSGDISWSKTFGGTATDEAYAVQQTNEGDFIVAGITKSNNGNVSGNHGDADFWVIKVNASGNLVWSKTYGGSTEDIAQSVRQTNDGNFVVAGFTYSSDGDLSGNFGSRDLWILKISPSGTLIWDKIFGGSGVDTANDIYPTSDNGFILVGSSNSSDGNLTNNQGSYDLWVVKLKSTGTLQWQKSFGGTSEDTGKSIQQTNTDAFIIAGHTQSNNGDVTNNYGFADAWIVKLTQETTLGTDELAKDKVKFYPNPVKEILHFSEKINEISILDTSGKLVYSQKSALKEINISHLPKGNYLLKCTAENNEIMTFSFIKN